MPGLGSRSLYDHRAGRQAVPDLASAIDPQYGCYFGHEHGDDPRTSVLFSEVGMPPFGYVNGVEGQRKEDHFGNKVFVVNDDSRGGSLLVKMHQGTHSPDAFVNNLHELQYHYRNRDGRRLDIMILAAFGKSGEIRTGCGANGGQIVQTGTPTNYLGSGVRSIPSAACFALPNIPYEDWLSGNHITSASNYTQQVPSLVFGAETNHDALGVHSPN